jgi:hypothetical protein
LAGRVAGKGSDVSYLLVSENDGRILAVLESREEIAKALEQARSEHSRGMPLAVVAFHEAPGSIIGTQTSVTMRPFG